MPLNDGAPDCTIPYLRTVDYKSQRFGKPHGGRTSPLRWARRFCVPTSRVVDSLCKLGARCHSQTYLCRRIAILVVPLPISAIPITVRLDIQINRGTPL